VNRPISQLAGAVDGGARRDRDASQEPLLHAVVHKKPSAQKPFAQSLAEKHGSPGLPLL